MQTIRQQDHEAQPGTATRDASPARASAAASVHPAKYLQLLPVVLLLAAAMPARLCHGLATEEEGMFVSDAEHFPGWKGTLPGAKGGAFGGDPNRARSMHTGSLGKVTCW